MNVHGIIAALFIVLDMSPVDAGVLRRRRRRRRESRKSHRRNLPTITDIILASGAPDTFDRNKYDYDILREGVINNNLEEALATTKDITVFAPNDNAFFLLAQELGFSGPYNERQVIYFIRTVLDGAGERGELITSVLLYHVVPEKISASRLKRLSRRNEMIDTLLGKSITVYREHSRIRLGDVATDIDDPQVRTPFNIYAKNGIVHTIDRVLRPRLV